MHRTLRPLLAALSVFFFAGSCASADPPRPETYTAAYAERVVSVGFGHVANRYIDGVALRKFALDGLRGMSRLEPAFEVRDTGATIEIAVSGQRVARLAAPAEDSARAWAELAVQAIDAGRAASKPLAAAEAEAVFQALFDGGIAGLDPFSRYAGAVEAEDARAQRDGFGGIGVTLRMEANEALIVSVTPGGPAAAAGVQAEDRITQVDGQAVDGWQQRDLVRAIRGPVGAAVALTVRRAGGPSALNLHIQRERITLPTVVAETRDGMLILRVSSFNQETSQALGRAVAGARADAEQTIRGVVLDLRNNPGGLLDQAVYVADHFLERGDIVTTRGRHPQSQQRFGADPRDFAERLPLVVLINGGSASGSEVVAAALQDQGRAVLVGTNSYGKGTVQTVVRLPNNGELTLTWSRMLAPSGYVLHGLGVLPNVCTHGAGDVAEAAKLLSELKAGRSASAAVLPAWRANTTPAVGAQLAQLRQTCRADNKAPDVDLAVAEALLADPQLYHNVLAMSATALAGR